MTFPGRFRFRNGGSARVFVTSEGGDRVLIVEPAFEGYWRDRPVALLSRSIANDSIATYFFVKRADHNHGTAIPAARSNLRDRCFEKLKDTPRRNTHHIFCIVMVTIGLSPAVRL